MNWPTMTEAMKASISEVLEQMFFLPFDFVGAAESSLSQSDNGCRIGAKVAFHGRFSGMFVLLVPTPLGRSITADFMGLDPEAISTGQVADTMMEMINMLAGNCLSHYDQKALFDLQIPEPADSQTARRALDALPEMRVMNMATSDDVLSLALAVHSVLHE